MGEIECPDKQDRIRLNLPCKNEFDDNGLIGHTVCIDAKCFHLLIFDNGKNSMEACEIVRKQRGSLLHDCDGSCAEITRWFFPNAKVELKGVDCEER